MTRTTGIAGAALVFWGWQTDLLVLAVLGAIAAESSAVIPIRFDLGPREVRNVPRVCALALIGAAVVAFVTGDGGLGATLRTLQWMPLALLPLILAQRYGTDGRLDLNLLTGAGGHPRSRPVDVTFVFVAICLIAAGAANQRTPWYFAGLVTFAAWALLAVPAPASGTRRPLAFAVALTVAAALGYAGQFGLNYLQKFAMDAVVNLIVDSDGDTDPYRNTTALGQIGELKLSDSIVARVVSEDGAPPRYLYRAVYDRYGGGAWGAREAALEALSAAPEPGSWRIGEGNATRSVTVSGTVRGGKGVLPLPAGLVRIDDFPADAVRRNRLGSTEAEREQPWYRLEANYDPAAVPETSPGEADLSVPRSEAKTLARVLADIGRSDESARVAVAAIEAHFARGFEYSLYQPERENVGTPLADFLLRHRSGHCEYFATATALLLRAAGVPTRYATGYSVGEWSALEQAWVVRLRHAHAWVLAWVDGRWVEVDTTPAVWVSVESEQAAWYEPLLDRWSWLVHRFRQWRAGPRSGIPRGWLVAAVVVFIFAFVRYARRLRRARRAPVAAQSLARWAGADSRFFDVVRALEGRGIVRAPGEPAARWLERVAAHESDDSVAAIRRMDALHQRLRFDPEGLGAADHARFNAMATKWLAEFSRSRRAELPVK